MKEETIVITFTPKTGHINVEGPVNNEMLSLWMLEKAKDAVKDQHIPKKLVKPATSFEKEFLGGKDGKRR